MRKLRKIISVLMAGLTLCSMAPVNAETYNTDTTDEAVQAETPESSDSTKNQRGGGYR